jgi:hypothetical protein
VPAPARAALFVGAALAGAVLTTGCGVPPELRDPPGAVVPSPRTAPPTGGPTTIPSLPPTEAPSTGQPTATPTFSEAQAVPCNGQPSAAQVLALLRRTSGLLPSGVNATVGSGTPLCAGTWQYTVVNMPRQDPMLVVTRGAPGALTLVTAGTNVCNIPVRSGAPAGIRTVACEAGSAPGGV